MRKSKVKRKTYHERNLLISFQTRRIILQEKERADSSAGR